ncbi:hypothetical protein BASA60_004138 [Batrachochytrium salamandrivorans]|nr:hypothetical protein BASA62_009194 [Batrachochytrium salamandrivorans]KAH6577203.1 hypothetical protein BASA60_004138 [Batrachochytrium salamandrivorans]
MVDIIDYTTTDIESACSRLCILDENGMMRDASDTANASVAPSSAALVKISDSVYYIESVNDGETPPL